MSFLDLINYNYNYASTRENPKPDASVDENVVGNNFIIIILLRMMLATHDEHSFMPIDVSNKTIKSFRRCK